MSQTYDKLRASRQPRERKAVVRPARARGRGDMATRRTGQKKESAFKSNASKIFSGLLDFWDTLTLKGKIVSVVGLLLVSYILLWLVRYMTMDTNQMATQPATSQRSVPVPLDFAGELPPAPAVGSKVPRFDPAGSGRLSTPISRLPQTSSESINGRIPRTPPSSGSRIPPPMMPPPEPKQVFPNVVPNGRYRVVVGSFSNQDNADSLKRRIESKGVPALVERTKGNGWTRVQVQLGPFDSADDAKTAITILRKKTGIKGRLNTSSGSIDRRQTQSRPTPNYPPPRSSTANRWSPSLQKSSLAPNNTTPPPQATPKKIRTRPTPPPAPKRAEPAKRWSPPPKAPVVETPQRAPVTKKPDTPSRKDGKYIVLIGSFTSWSNAEKFRKTIAKQGLPVWLRSVDVNGRTYTRVQLGPFANKAQAKETIDYIRRTTDIKPRFLMANPDDRQRPSVDRQTSRIISGGGGSVQEAPPSQAPGASWSASASSASKGGVPARRPGRYLVFVGSFSDADNADRLRKRLEAKGIPVRMKSDYSNGRQINHVQVGPFATEQDAQRTVDIVRDRTGLSAKSVHTKGVIERGPLWP